MRPLEAGWGWPWCSALLIAMAVVWSCAAAPSKAPSQRSNFHMRKFNHLRRGAGAGLILLSLGLGAYVLLSGPTRIQVAWATTTPLGMQQPGMAQQTDSAEESPTLPSSTESPALATPSMQLDETAEQPGAPSDTPSRPAGVTPTTIPIPTLSFMEPQGTPFGGGTGVIAFVSTRNHAQDADQIYRMQLDGSELMRLTYSAAVDTRPSWSPDGESIVFQTWVEPAHRYDLHVMDASGANRRQLTGQGTSDEFPTWSIDGEWILYDSQNAGRQQLYQIRADGRAIERVRVSDLREAVASWSPDGTRLLFSAQREEDAWQIYTAAADGSHLNRLTHTMARNVRPAWSPDGQQVAFISWRDGNGELYVMNADSSAQIRLTYGMGRVNSPSWSPDGEWILLHAMRNEGFDLFLIRPDGSALYQITDHPADDYNGVWQPAASSASP